MDRLADLALVAVGRGGVDVPVPGAQGRAHSVAGLVGGRLEDAQAERWHLDTVVEGYGFHGAVSLWVLGGAGVVPR